MGVIVAFLLENGGKVDWQRGEKDVHLQAALVGARESGGVVLVYFAATWCRFCSRLDAGALSSDEVVTLTRPLHRVLVDCTDRDFYREMTKKYSLQGLPTLAVFDGRGAKIDEHVGVSSDVGPILALLRRAAGRKGGTSPTVQDTGESARKRLEDRLREAEERLRREIRKVLEEGLAQLRREKPLTERIAEFAAKLRDDGDLHFRLKKFLSSPKGREKAAAFLQGADIDQTIDRYFEKDRDGRYSIRREYEDEIREFLEENEEKPEEKPQPKRRAWLGFTPDDFTDEERAKLGLEKGWGIRVLEVAPNGPAYAAGIRAGDILLMLGDKRVGDENVRGILEAQKPGDVVEAVLLRGTAKVSVRVTLGEKRE